MKVFKLQYEKYTIGSWAFMNQTHVLIAEIGCVKYCHKSLPTINL